MDMSRNKCVFKVVCGDVGSASTNALGATPCMIACINFSVKVPGGWQPLLGWLGGKWPHGRRMGNTQSMSSYD